jgi:hypothetical protein
MSASSAFILGGWFGIAWTLIVILYLYREDIFPE